MEDDDNYEELSDIEIDDDIAFQLSCVKNKIDSVKILMELNDKYYAMKLLNII